MHNPHRSAQPFARFAGKVCFAYLWGMFALSLLFAFLASVLHAPQNWRSAPGEFALYYLRSCAPMLVFGFFYFISLWPLPVRLLLAGALPTGAVAVTSVAFQLRGKSAGAEVAWLQAGLMTLGAVMAWWLHRMRSREE